MKNKRISNKSMLSVCTEIYEDDGINPKLYRKNVRKQSGRKTLQLCSQIAQALHLALSDCGDDALRNLYVLKIEPLDISRVLVKLAQHTQDPTPITELYQRLGSLQNRLRAEIATAIHRKRTPELTFTIYGFLQKQ